jgi:hypothetical protein
LCTEDLNYSLLLLHVKFFFIKKEGRQNERKHEKMKDNFCSSVTSLGVEFLPLNPQPNFLKVRSVNSVGEPNNLDPYSAQRHCELTEFAAVQQTCNRAAVWEVAHIREEANFNYMYCHAINCYSRGLDW